MMTAVSFAASRFGISMMPRALQEKCQARTVHCGNWRWSVCVTRERLNEGDLFVAPSNSTQRPSIYFELIFLYGIGFRHSKIQNMRLEGIMGPAANMRTDHGADGA